MSEEYFEKKLGKHLIVKGYESEDFPYDINDLLEDEPPVRAYTEDEMNELWRQWQKERLSK